MICNDVDFIYPMQADVYYPIVEQGVYGNLKKQWFHDRTIACNFSPEGSAGAEEVKPNVDIRKENVLIGRVKKDLRISANNERQSITNIVISNIRTSQVESIYVETAGVRSGLSTIYEVATQEPIVGPFGDVEYYKVVLRRSENQATDI